MPICGGHGICIESKLKNDAENDAEEDADPSTGEEKVGKRGNTTKSKPSDMTAATATTVMSKAGKCVCDDGWIGGACSKMECPELCNHNGICMAGECECHSGYIGTTCNVMECPHGCSGHGTCVSRNYTTVNPINNETRVVQDGVECRCDSGWGGDDFDCRINMQCVDDCGFQDGRGKCQNGRCYCADGWGGEGCLQRQCMNGCSGHGTCIKKENNNGNVWRKKTDDIVASCQCESTWTGEICDQRE